MLFFNHCKHQSWGVWWRANWLLLCALIRLGFWCLSSPISVPELYEWHHHVTSDSEICTFTAFLRLRLRSLSISPAPDTAPQLKQGKVPPHRRALLWASICHSVTAPNRVHQETCALLSHGPLAHALISAALGNPRSQGTQELLVGIRGECPSTTVQSRSARATLNETSGV